MGNIFGPSDPELKAAEENPIKRNQIIEVSQLELVVNIGEQLNKKNRGADQGFGSGSGRVRFFKNFS